MAISGQGTFWQMLQRESWKYPKLWFSSVLDHRNLGLYARILDQESAFGQLISSHCRKNCNRIGPWNLLLLNTLAGPGLHHQLCFQLCGMWGVGTTPACFLRDGVCTGDGKSACNGSSNLEKACRNYQKEPGKAILASFRGVRGLLWHLSSLGHKPLWEFGKL